MGRIEPDRSRFRQIVRGAVKRDLRKYISNGELIARKGNNRVSIPLPRIEIPHFRFDRGERGGVGIGDGDIGEVIGGKPDHGTQAGDMPGEHVLEVELSLDELAEILGEELKLPRLEPKGQKNLTEELRQYKGIYTAGPECLRHRRRTYKEALKRQISLGTYNPEHPVIIPQREDRRYRSTRNVKQQACSAVIIYVMDVSGSMGDIQREIVRTESFWIDTWLKKHYPRTDKRYIVHDVVAKEVDQHTFEHVKGDGGTKISSAYEKCSELVDKNYRDYNVYVFHFSDGDNFNDEDDALAVQVLRSRLVPQSNLFGYGQVKTDGRRGRFIDKLRAAFSKEKKVVCSEINDKDAIYNSIKTFFGGK